LAFIESLVQKLTQRLAGEMSTRVFIESREVQQQQQQPVACILVNDDKTRSFWCWKVQSNPILLRILNHVDACLQEYDQPVYYDPPQFHVSIASFDGDLSSLIPFVDTFWKNRAKMDMTSTTITNGNDKQGQEQVEEEDTGNDDDDDDDDDSNTWDCRLIKVDRLVCTFGTTKTYTIPLARA
jgi:hypothetical protein